MEKSAVVSIIIPIYNAEQYLEKCIDSVINQTYKNIEIILIDDYSTDGSLSICEKYAERDCRIVIAQTKGKGVSAARNTGIKIAKGTFIQFLDSDDELVLDATEMLLKYIKDSDLCVGNYYINKEKAFSELEMKTYDIENYVKKFILDNVYEDLGNYPWNKLYRTEIINKMNCFDENIDLGEDAVFNLQYLQNIKTIGVTDVCVCIHYERTNSLLTRERSVQELHYMYMQKFIEYEKIFKVNKIDEKNKHLIATKLLYLYLILTNIYQVREGSISEFLKREYCDENRKKIKMAKGVNINYKIFRFLFIHKNLKFLFICFCKFKYKFSIN